MPSAIDTEFLNKEGPKTMSLHAPPVKSIPHQEYPKMLYLWPKDKKLHPTAMTAVANNAEEEKALAAKGYRTKPHTQEFEAVDMPEGFEPDLPKVEPAKPEAKKAN
jgi:hypothetical protein